MIFPDYWSEERLGEALISAGAMTPDDWERALAEVRGAKLQIGPALDALGWVAEKDLCAIVVGAFRVPYVPENLCRPDPGALSLLPNDTLRQTSVLPLARFGEALTIAIPGFLRTDQLEEIRRASGCTPMPLVALPSVVRAKVKLVLEGEPEPPPASLRDLTLPESRPEDPHPPQVSAADAPAKTGPAGEVRDPGVETPAVAPPAGAGVRDPRAPGSPFEPRRSG